MQVLRDLIFDSTFLLNRLAFPSFVLNDVTSTFFLSFAVLLYLMNSKLINFANVLQVELRHAHFAGSCQIC